jgi:Ribonuclease toxin, BrnT, of type II toxin-antitoxin system
VSLFATEAHARLPLALLSHLPESTAFRVTDHLEVSRRSPHPCLGIHLSIHYPQVVWDPANARANLAAHGVDFAEAAPVLDDDRALTREDEDSVGEERFVTVG